MAPSCAREHEPALEARGLGDRPGQRLGCTPVAAVGVYCALGYTLILAIVFGLASVDLDVIRVAVNHRAIGTLLIATIGAVLYGVVVGALQWRVLRGRVTIPRRSWVRASVIPALIIWILIVVPADITADSSGQDLRVAYFLRSARRSRLAR